MAHEYRAQVLWTRGDAAFLDNRYSRGHVWRFDGGVEVPASSSPHSVPLPLSRADAVDPEEAFVAALSSCHMLFFLYFAAKAGFVVDRYEDAAVGVMSKNERGKFFVSKVTLNPSVAFTGAKQPTDADLGEMHHRAHEECYVANSVRSEVVIGATRVSFS
ncbi:MAG TPA: OsmC family protein [Xanthobacteraceae bacterium]|nr:OsmC family protein [Xanthobacteraceae bacterium]